MDKEALFMEEVVVVVPVDVVVLVVVEVPVAVVDVVALVVVEAPEAVSKEATIYMELCMWANMQVREVMDVVEEGAGETLPCMQFYEAD